MTDQMTHGLDELIARIERIEHAARDLKRPLHDSADYMLGSLDKNFEVGGRPPWKLLATGEVPHLTQSGAMRGANKPIFENDGWRIVNTDPKAAWHLQGTEKDGKERMPARNWMLFQPEDIPVVGNIFFEHLIH